MKKISVRTFVAGNVTAYAPSTAATAPLAPMTGIRPLGSEAQNASIATTPPSA